MIDIHLHYTRPAWIEALWSPEKRLASFWPKLNLHMSLLTDPRLALLAMDIRGSARAVIYPEISIAPGPQIPGGPAAALAITRQMNDTTAALVARYPDRFIGVAIANPLGDVQDLAEVRRAIVALGLRGVAVGASYQGATIDNVGARPFLDLVQALDVPLIIHPSADGGMLHQRDFGLDLLVGMPAELAAVAVRLMVSGRLAEFPRLKIILTHLGGGLLSMLGWLTALTESSDMQSAELVKRFWVDTATASRAVLSLACAVLGPEHVMLGTDWPLLHGAHTGDAHTDPALMPAALSMAPDQQQAILHENARRLFG